MNETTVHVQALINASRVREEQIDGEAHIVVPATTLPFGIVMNGILYPEEFIMKRYQELEGSPAPLGHPVIDGEKVPAGTPRAVNAFGVGAYNRNVKVKDGRVEMEKVINKRIAESTDKGRELLKAIYDEKPIHTSTGLDAILMPDKGEANGKTYNRVIADGHFDHDAFLIGESGAATPDEGVGVLTNSENVIICNASDAGTDTTNESINELKDNHMSDFTQEETGVLRKLLNAFKGEEKQEPAKTEPVVNADETKAEAGTKSLDADTAKLIAEAISQGLKEGFAAITEQQSNAKKEAEKEGEKDEKTEEKEEQKEETKEDQKKDAKVTNSAAVLPVSKPNTAKKTFGILID